MVEIPAVSQVVDILVARRLCHLANEADLCGAGMEVLNSNHRARKKARIKERENKE